MCKKSTTEYVKDDGTAVDAEFNEIKGKKENFFKRHWKPIVVTGAGMLVTLLIWLIASPQVSDDDAGSEE